MKKPQGPSIWGLFKDYQTLLNRRHELFQSWQKQYGDIVPFGLLKKRRLFFHPDHAQFILKDHAKDFCKPLTLEEFRPLVGFGLFSSEGELWKKQRKIISPEFAPRRIEDYMPVMTHATKVMLDFWSEKATDGEDVLDINHEIMKLTLAIVCETFFGDDMRQEASIVGQAVSDVWEYSTRRALAFFKLPKFIPTLAQHRIKKSLRKLDRVIYAMIAQNKKSQPQQVNLLSRLLSARNPENGEPLSNKQLRDEIITFIVAGHETTASALSWTLWLVAQHPEVEEKIKFEIQNFLNGRLPTKEDLANLRYTGMVLLESMRLYPPAPTIARTALTDIEIEGVVVPAQSLVITAPCVTHRHPDFWENPDQFNPDRFLPENSKNRHPFAYFPFGGGPRKCIGEHFAMIEAIFILAMIYQRFDLKNLPGHIVHPHALLTLRPKKQVLMRIKK